MSLPDSRDEPAPLPSCRFYKVALDLVRLDQAGRLLACDILVRAWHSIQIQLRVQVPLPKIIHSVYSSIVSVSFTNKLVFSSDHDTSTISRPPSYGSYCGRRFVYARIQGSSRQRSQLMTFAYDDICGECCESQY